MSFCQRLLLLFSLSLSFSFLIVVSNTEAADRIKVKKVVALNKTKDVAASRLGSRHRPQLEEEYLVQELSPVSGIAGHTAPPQKNEVLQKAFSLLGIKYRFGGSSYAGMDCSAFVKKVFSTLNLPLPRTAREQYALGTDVSPAELQQGDLLFYHTYAGFPSHVGIFIGNDLMIHASSGGGRVMISRINTPYFLSHFIGARRIPSGEGGFLRELAAEEELETAPAEVSS